MLKDKPPEFKRMMIMSSILHALLFIGIIIYPLLKANPVKAQTIQTIRLQNIIIPEIKKEEPPKPKLPEKKPEIKQEKKIEPIQKPKKVVKPKPKKVKPKKQKSKPKKPEKSVEEKIQERLKKLDKNKWENPKTFQKKNRETPKPKPQAASSITALENFPYTWYLTTLQNKVKQVWSQPQDTILKKGAQIKFLISRNGGVSQVKLIQTSGSSLMDESAMRAVREGSPYAPLPRQYDGNSLTVTIIFELE